MYIRTYVVVCMYVYDTPTYVNIDVRICTYVHASIYVHTYIHEYTYVSIPTYVNTGYAHMYAHTYVCTEQPTQVQLTWHKFLDENNNYVRVCVRSLNESNK